MASGFFILLDDIATILDDVSAMTKVAVQKTAGVLGDDLALNAQQVSGVDANRELPIVFSVAKGSALNKVVLIPVAMLRHLTASLFERSNRHCARKLASLCCPAICLIRL